MRVRVGRAILATALLGACVSSRGASSFESGELRQASAMPEARPVVSAAAPRLVPYPGLEVAYVDGAGVECFCHRGSYYTFAKGNWFYSKSLAGTWAYIEMKFVPPDLFRVRGHLPPQLEGRPIPTPPPPSSVDEY